MAARLLLIEPSAIDITSAYEANAVDATGSDFSSSALVSGPSPTVRVIGMNATETPSMNASKHKATGPARAVASICTRRIDEARGAIESQLRAQEMGGSLDVLSKYRWIAGRFNQFASERADLNLDPIVTVG